MNYINEYKRGLNGGIPIALGYLSVSFAFGLMATREGLSLFHTLLISMTNLTSAGQFAGLEIIKNNGGILELTIATFIINIRYLLMSLSLSQKIDPSAKTSQRLLMSFGITDENFALAMQEKKEVTFPYFLGIMTLPYFGWSAGTFFGGFASGLLPELLRASLGIAIYGMFIAIIVPPAKESKPVLNVILIAAAVSILLNTVPVLKNISAGWKIIISTLIASASGAALYPQKENDQDEQ